MAEGSSRSYHFGGSLVLDDPEVIEVPPEVAAGWNSGSQKRKRAQVAPHEIIELDADDDPDGVTIIDAKTPDYKNKQAVGYPVNYRKNAKIDLAAEDIACPSAISAKVVYPWDGLGTYHGGPKLPIYGLPADVAGPSSFPSYSWKSVGTYHTGTLLPAYFDDVLGAVKEDHYAYDEDDFSNYSYNTPLMENYSSFNLNVDHYVFPPSVGLYLPRGHVAPADSTQQRKQVKIVESEIDEKYKAFKQFDTVGDHSDHFYLKFRTVKKPSKDWVKRIQHEWKVLGKDLPDTIFVRAYEDRMDLLRAVIVGPAGTPYHDGLFFFDVYFPSQYPCKPPQVSYRSGGLRLNPNLYACGKVCLSLLNTWTGSGCEMWNPSSSTMLQVLVSIQALVLNAKPYFNEPGHSVYANTPHGEQHSLAYNEETFLLSCRTMLYSLRNPPKHFEHFIGGHFRKYGRDILVGCKAYMGGAQVGCLAGNGVQDVDEGDKSCSQNFKCSLEILMKGLVNEFTDLGVGCHEFQAQAVNPGAAADTTLRL
uniref:E2 ubiquitin-conjugating enzyme n=1 Tax=Hordeum vulgare subsp. vulgare TaxID=112509 RepID=F2EBZ0_HORVV|nr:predicted protein [Hordeum vulgare subsp. vulgare]